MGKSSSPGLLQGTLDLVILHSLHRGLAQERGNPIPLGDTRLIREQALDLWRFPVLEDLWHDLVYAIRSHRRSPALALSAILSLGLGIGAYTAIFSLVDKVLIRT